MGAEGVGNPDPPKPGTGRFGLQVDGVKLWLSVAAIVTPVLVVTYLLIGSGGQAGPEETVLDDGDIEDTVPLGMRPAGGDGPPIVSELDDDDYYTDFSEPLGDEWLLYDSIGHAGWGLRRPSAIGMASDPTAAGGSVLTITASMGTGDAEDLVVSGGIKLLRPQTYGRYTMRVKVDKDPAEVTSGVGLLWPASNRWPEDGEIDIFESWRYRATRTPVESNLHWLNPEAEPPYERSDDLKTLQLHVGVDGSEWHVYQLEWREDLVSVSIDGNEPAVLSTNPDEIADWDMEPTLQLDAFPTPTDLESQPELEIDVVMYVDYLAIQD